MSYDSWKSGDNGDNYREGGNATHDARMLEAHEARLRGEEDPRIARAHALAERVKAARRDADVLEDSPHGAAVRTRKGRP